MEQTAETFDNNTFQVYLKKIEKCILIKAKEKTTSAFYSIQIPDDQVQGLTNQYFADVEELYVALHDGLQGGFDHTNVTLADNGKLTLSSKITIGRKEILNHVLIQLEEQSSEPLVICEKILSHMQTDNSDISKTFKEQSIRMFSALLAHEKNMEKQIAQTAKKYEEKMLETFKALQAQQQVAPAPKNEIERISQDELEHAYAELGKRVVQLELNEKAARENPKEKALEVKLLDIVEELKDRDQEGRGRVSQLDAEIPKYRSKYCKILE